MPKDLHLPLPNFSLSLTLSLTLSFHSPHRTSLLPPLLSPLPPPLVLSIKFQASLPSNWTTHSKQGPPEIPDAAPPAHRNLLSCLSFHPSFAFPSVGPPLASAVVLVCSIALPLCSSLSLSSSSSDPQVLSAHTCLPRSLSFHSVAKRNIHDIPLYYISPSCFTCPLSASSFHSHLAETSQCVLLSFLCVTRPLSSPVPPPLPPALSTCWARPLQAGVLIASMWSNFLVQQDDEGRIGVAGAGPGGGLSGLTGKAVRGQRRTHRMTDSQEGKIKLAFLVAIVGVTLTVLGVGTEFWVELAQPKHFSNNQTCQTAHYGLWKGCIRTLWVADIDPERGSCGPAELPGESNCTHFKFFTSGTNAVIFKKTTNKSLNIGAAVLALLSLTMMVMGSICITMSLSKGVPFFLKPASFCFILSGVLVLLSIVVFHQSVLALLASDHSVPLHHELSWSVACVGSAGAILIVGGILFLILSLPYSPWEKCLPHKDSAT